MTITKKVETEMQTLIEDKKFIDVVNKLNEVRNLVIDTRELNTIVINGKDTVFIEKMESKINASKGLVKDILIKLDNININKGE